MTLLPDPPTQLAAEPWRLFLAPFPLPLVVGFALIRVVSSSLPCLVLSCGVWLEQKLIDPAAGAVGSRAGYLGHWLDLLSLEAGWRRRESMWAAGITFQPGPKKAQPAGLCLWLC